MKIVLIHLYPSYFFVIRIDNSSVGLDAVIEISDKIDISNKIDIKITIYILFKEWINTTKNTTKYTKCNLILIRVMVCLYPQVNHRRHRHRRQ